MTDEPPDCAYCGHPPAHHAPGRCYTERRAPGGDWAPCTCTDYQPGEEP